MSVKWQIIGGALLIGAIAVGSSGLSGCAADNLNHNDGRYKLRRQLQAYGEFHGQNVATEYAKYYEELKERQSRGELPQDMTVNQYYDWLKQQEKDGSPR